MVYMVLEPYDIDHRVTLNFDVIRVAIDDLRREMAACMVMTDDQEQFFYYLVGQNSAYPPLPLVQLLEVANNLQHVIDCCPNADTFDKIRFPLAERLKRVYKLREKAIGEASKGRNHKPRPHR